MGGRIEERTFQAIRDPLKDLLFLAQVCLMLYNLTLLRFDLSIGVLDRILGLLLRLFILCRCHVRYIV